ncbi:GGDEF domain-containing protein [Pseudomaricurvus hydrocarbonicus]|nr:GGDEF domain-containing protein [Aestuariicella hydrocarbonica]
MTPDLQDREVDEVSNKIYLINLFGWVGAGITLVLGVNAIFHQNLFLAGCLLLVSFAYLMVYVLLKVFNPENTYVYSASLILSVLCILMVYLVYTGGVANTGPLWIYLLPPVAMFFTGMKRGLVVVGVFTVVVWFMLLYRDGALLKASYPVEFKLRLLYSFLTVAFLSASYEFSRQVALRHFQRLNDQFQRQAQKDFLTDLLNRRGMMEAIEREYHRSRRFDHDMSLVLCDVDYFKRVNDQYGHEAGDYVLKRLASVLLEELRGQDQVSRWGGEEFMILLPETDASNAEYLAERLRLRVQQTIFEYNGQRIPVSISLGVCKADTNESVADVIREADKHLYMAKDSGRNKVVTKRR